MQKMSYPPENSVRLGKYSEPEMLFQLLTWSFNEEIVFRPSAPALPATCGRKKNLRHDFLTKMLQKKFLPILFRQS